MDRETNERLDRLAGVPRSAEGKNHVHACRPGHPLGRDNGWKWATALATVNSHRGFDNRPEPADLQWLERKADEEAAWRAEMCRRAVEDGVGPCDGGPTPEEVY